MQAEQQQRILGYFIEEAKDHLNTIEQGLLNLQSTIEDPELLYEVYRAAHSVKGGAAMLGLNSIQQTSHRLEDSFKILEKIRDKCAVRVDQQLESLFLQIFDTLQALIDSLSGPYGLTDEAAQTLLQEVEPVFEALKYHIGQLAQQNDVTVTELTLPTVHTAAVASPAPVAAVAAPVPRPAPSRSGENSAQELFFRSDVPDYLREMLQQFKQPEEPKNRRQLQEICRSLLRAGETFDLPNWVTFINTIEQVIAYPENTYSALAPIIIKSIKQAQELVLEHRDDEIIVSDSLKDLLPPAPAPIDEVTELDLESDEISLLELLEAETTEAEPPSDRSAETAQISQDSDLDIEAESSMIPDEIFEQKRSRGPQIPPEELKSLADLFDGEGPIEENWQEETLIEKPEADQSLNRSSSDELDQDFIDLFEQLDDGQPSVGPADSSEDLFALADALDSTEVSEVASDSEEMGVDEFDDLLNIGRSSTDSPPTPAAPTPRAELEEMSFEDLFTELEGDNHKALDQTLPTAEATSSSNPDSEDLYHELFDNYQEEEETVPDPSTAFEDLFNLDLAEEEDLTDETTVSNPATTATETDFTDLDSLLNEEETASSEPTPSTAEIDEDLDLFANLDQLLNESDIDQDSAVEADNSEDDDFKELEKLLEDSPGGNRASAILRPTPKRSAPIYEPIAKVPVKQLDNLSNLMGELVVNRNSLEQDQERMRQFLDNLLDQVSLLSDVGQRMQDFYERSLLEISLLSNRKPSPWPTQAPLSESLHRHDELEFESTELDRFTPFHTLSQEIIELVVRVRESAADIEFLVEEADQVSRQLRQVTTQLREGLTKARMEPFSQEADRLKRPVRDISIKCGKQAELYVEGRDTLIDKMLLGKLHDPLIHLVNNAITHGIEPPEVRQAAGKPATGRIMMKVFHQGNQTVIAISDDGAGIDTEKVKEKALRKRLITPEQANLMSSLDIYDLLFHPGFSMKDQADEFAGRGVGMDVVRTSLMEVRGTVTTDSTLGQGTTFTIRLPLNMSISRALCCISDRARIAFPMDGVEDMIDVPKDQIQAETAEQQTLEWRGSKLPFRHLRDLLTYNRHLGRGNVYGTNTDEDMISVIVLRSSGNYLAVQVDQVLVEQEIVIKQLEGPIPKPVGIAGATVLGDGQIVAIADVLELIDLAMGRIRRDSRSKIWKAGDSTPEQPVEHKSEPTVLIVDDSITVRSLLSITFEKSGYRVEEARDGKEAWEKLKSGLPCDLVFCDIEMPRMDGLELLSRMQKDSQLSELPIAMLTSRGADRHRQMAYQLGARGYFTKPYLEEQLLEAAQRMLKGEVVGLPAGGVEAAI
jgi:chemotaxis protein histidine kinase CheA/ActR/RegA family two-component response regulator